MKARDKEYFWTVPISKHDRPKVGFKGLIVKAKYKTQAYRKAHRHAGEMYKAPRVNKSRVHKATAGELKGHIDVEPPAHRSDYAMVD